MPMMIDDPFSNEPMDEKEISECVETLLRTYGNLAGSFLTRELKGASGESARSNWLRIAHRYADLVERTAHAHRAALMDISAQPRATGNLLN